MTVQDVIFLLENQIKQGLCQASDRILFLGEDEEGPCNLSSVAVQEVLHADDDSGSVILASKSHFEELVELHAEDDDQDEEAARRYLQSELTKCVILS